MRYLGLALFAEGVTDHRFLRPLLRRLCEKLCLEKGRSLVDVSDVLELHSPESHRDQERDVRILEAARGNAGAWNVLFIHTDGAGEPERAKSERVAPAAKRIVEELALGSQTTVAIVPVKETEAWALADGNALREIFETPLNDKALGVPMPPKLVEREEDPKKLLEMVYRTAAGGLRRRQRQASAAKLLEPIGQRISLDALRKVPAFKALEGELRDALCRLRYLEP